MAGDADSDSPLETPDGRYIVVNGRLWRKGDPAITEQERQHLVRELMDARRAVGLAMRKKDLEAENVARKQVDEIKTELGERGPVWWDDGAPDYGRKMAKNTAYAEWFAKVAHTVKIK